MDDFVWFTTVVLDPIGIWIGVILAVPIIWTWYTLTFGRRARHRRWFDAMRKAKGNRPAILIVDLFDKGDATVAVERFRQNDDVLRNIPEENIFVVQRSKHLTASDIPDIVAELRAIAEEIFKNGTETLHYFHAGPGVTAAFVGVQFANACRVIIYQHSQGEYLNWGPLKHTP
ncbi:MAG: hypothetical protein GVY13_12515 [Alphaproteobacteria bacterium]|jgi:hypothetical protein|nr:hypothetical protein [Alphaproteobacteria bacterium]